MKATMLLIGALVLLLTGCGGDASSGNTNNTVELSVGEGVAIPDGYTLVEASAYGQFDNNLTLYLQHKESGRVYEYQNGKIGDEIVLPEGYSLVAVSAYGKFHNNRTFYCRKNGTDQVFVCQPK